MMTMCTLVSLDELQKPQCILCNAVFSDANMKPSKLQEHFNNKHGGGGVEGHDFESLKTKRAYFQSCGTLPRLGFVSVDKPLLLALYQVVYKVTKSKKLYTIAEELIKPCALEMATMGQGTRKKLELVLLSNNIIHNWIGDLSDDILDQVISYVRFSALKISLQLAESTEVSNCSQLIALVRYVSDGIVKEDFLFFEVLKTTT